MSANLHSMYCTQDEKLDLLTFPNLQTCSKTEISYTANVTRAIFSLNLCKYSLCTEVNFIFPTYMYLAHFLLLPVYSTVYLT